MRISVSVEVPDPVGRLDQHYLREALVATLYYNGKLSESVARRTLGMTRRAFQEMLPRYGFSILIDSKENLDIERDA